MDFSNMDICTCTGLHAHAVRVQVAHAFAPVLRRETADDAALHDMLS